MTIPEEADQLKEPSLRHLFPDLNEGELKAVEKTFYGYLEICRDILREKLPPKDQPRVKAALISMQKDPFVGDIKRLKGQPAAWRRRVGNYRIVYDLHVDQRLIVVAGILRRTSTTY